MAHWVEGGCLTGILLTALTPFFALYLPLWLLGLWVLLPAYMLHQFEEHDRDRFRLWVNTRMAGGRDVLGPIAVFVINVPGVWGVIAVACALAAFIRPGLGLIAVYLVLVNALGHIAGAVITRAGNPGLITAIALFLPLGVAALLGIQHQGPSLADHARGLATALLIHAAIILHIRLRLAHLARSPARSNLRRPRGNTKP
jgi:hypothetical protein